ncbi:lysylphosphatidylglycerol synthase transmembrane domain-containing protein [Acidothermaceae bacterium B102]|nr:lysylphosphatidylglycerol synthase transmembrane domain-containing protein [Acidothermaceae bacterium B102]
MRTPPWLWRALRVGFVVLAVGLLVAALIDQWHNVSHGWHELPVSSLVLAGAGVLLGLFFSALAWRALLSDLGQHVPVMGAVRVFFVGQLGKYLPGSVWPVVAQMELGKAYGLSKRPVGTVALIVMVLNVATGLLVAVVLLPFTSPHALHQYGWAIAFLPVGLALLHPRVLNPVIDKAFSLARREPLEQPLTLRGIAIATGWTLLMWASYGGQIWALAAGLHAHHAASLPAMSTGAFALAWTAGFLFIISPAGAGVREAILIVALATVLGHDERVALAAVSRLLMTAGDLVWGAVGGLTRPRRNTESVGSDLPPTALAHD